MKRLFYLATLVASVFFFSACAEDPAEAIDVEGTFTDKAIIEGYVYLNTNKSSTEALKFAPEGTLLSFSIAYANLGVMGSLGSYVKTVAVDANGHYSVELPARTDGSIVPVYISGAQVLLTITADDGRSKDQIFRVIPTQQEIQKGFTYLKKLDYTEGDAFQESETWKVGTYQVKLEYYDGTRRLPVPRDTEVRVIVLKDRFVPERTNDWVFIKKVGSNGLLEIKMNAPSLLDGGLTFYWESAFVAEAVTRTGYDNNGDPINTYNDYKFDIGSSVTIYGEKTVDKGTLSATRGTQLTSN
jgi:hypothetical protein